MNGKPRFYREEENNCDCCGKRTKFALRGIGEYLTESELSQIREMFNEDPDKVLDRVSELAIIHGLPARTLGYGMDSEYGEFLITEPITEPFGKYFTAN